MQNTVLVFGGSGFLGSHICDKLILSGHKVINYDLNSTKFPNQYLEEVIDSIHSVDKVRKIILDNKIETVYHLAGLADIDDCHKDPLLAIESNILGTAKILEACKNTSVKKIVFSSSAYVSSDKGSIYRITKKACEELFEEYFKNYGLKYVILRFGSLYGPRSNLKNGIYRLIHEAVSYGKINYNGTGEETREFIHVLDAADLSLKVLEPQFECQKILITGTRSIQYKELISMINEILGNKLAISFQEKRSGTHYITTSYAYSKDICRKLVGDYHVDLGQGLLNIIEEIDRESTSHV